MMVVEIVRARRCEMTRSYIHLRRRVEWWCQSVMKEGGVVYFALLMWQMVAGSGDREKGS
jgi:hypothetical protein